MDPYRFTRCIELTRDEIIEAASSRERCKALFAHLASIARPNDGAPLVLLLFARLATTAGSWLDGDLRVNLAPCGDAEGETEIEVMAALGSDAAERVFPRARFKVPLSEFSSAVERIPQMISPLSLATTGDRMVLSATNTVRRSTTPMPASRAMAIERFAEAAGLTRHEPVTEPHKARAAFEALKRDEYVDVLASFVPVGYQVPGIEITKSPFSPFAGKLAGQKFLRFTRRDGERR